MRAAHSALQLEQSKIPEQTKKLDPVVPEV
jgi:hypothetical protein